MRTLHTERYYKTKNTKLQKYYTHMNTLKTQTNTKHSQTDYIQTHYTNKHYTQIHYTNKYTTHTNTQTQKTHNYTDIQKHKH